MAYKALQCVLPSHPITSLMLSPVTPPPPPPTHSTAVMLAPLLFSQHIMHASASWPLYLLFPISGMLLLVFPLFALFLQVFAQCHFLSEASWSFELKLQSPHPTTTFSIPLPSLSPPNVLYVCFLLWIFIILFPLLECKFKNYCLFCLSY